jgi:type I restriction enzyme S subunit
LGDAAELSGRIGWKGLTAKEYTREGPLFLSVHSLNYGDYVDFRDAFHISQERYDESPEIMLREGDVLICKDGAGIGKLGIVGELPSDTTINSSLLLIRAQECVLPKYLYFILSSPYFQKIVKSRLQGATTPHLYQRDISEFPVYLPSLSEQQRIVAVLDQTFAGLATVAANTVSNLKSAGELFETALVVDIFGDADEQGWETSTVAELALPKKGSIRTGPFGSQLLHSEFVDDGIAVLGIDNAVANEFRWGKSRFITPAKFALLSRYQVRPGDVLITIMGTCGRCAVVPDDIPVAINTKHLCCISLDRTRCLPEYLHAYFLHHPVARNYLATQAKGSIMAGLNMTIIERMPVRLPPIAKQKSIVQSMEFLRGESRRLEATYRQKLEAIDYLRQSALHRAFSGGLTSASSHAVKEAAE